MGRYNSDLCKAFDYFSNFVGDMPFKVKKVGFVFKFVRFAQVWDLLTFLHTYHGLFFFGKKINFI